MDNLESHDDRLVIPGTCFSIEPGIYLPEFGIRSEVNVYVAQDHALRDRRTAGTAPTAVIAPSIIARNIKGLSAGFKAK